MGANATVDNRASADEQLKEIKNITGGHFALVFDASAYGTDLALTALGTLSTATTKYFSSVDDWLEATVNCTNISD